MRFLRKLRQRVTDLERDMAALKAGGEVQINCQRTLVNTPIDGFTYIQEGPVQGKFFFNGREFVIILNNCSPR